MTEAVETDRVREARSLLANKIVVCAPPTVPGGPYLTGIVMTLDDLDVEAVFKRAQAAGVDVVEAVQHFLGRECRAHSTLFAMDPRGREFIAPANVAKLRATARVSTQKKGRLVDLLDLVTEIEVESQRRFRAAGLENLSGSN